MLMWTIISLGLVLVVALNIFGTNTVLSSHVNSAVVKQKLICLIWLIPYFGTIIAMMLVNKAIKRNSNNLSDNIASSLSNLANQFDDMESEIRDSRAKSSNKS